MTPNLDPFALAAELSDRLLIDGQLVPALAGRRFPVVNPATGEIVAQAAEADAADVDRAVTAAAAAQKSWRKLHPRERGRLVAECGRLLALHAEEIARLVALETGKALRTESRVEAGVLADVFVFFGGLGGLTVIRPERLTRRILAEMPAYADLVMALDAQRRPQAIRFRAP